MIVVDTNIIAYLHIEGEFTELSQRLYQNDSDWVVPKLWENEFQNVLTTCEKNNIIKEKLANTAWDEAHKRLSNKTYDVPADRVLANAIKYKISAYDSNFVTLAEILKVFLVTQDKKLHQLTQKYIKSLETY